MCSGLSLAFMPTVVPAEFPPWDSTETPWIEADRKEAVGGGGGGWGVCQRKEAGERDLKATQVFPCRMVVLEFFTLPYCTMKHVAGGLRNTEETITEPLTCPKSPSSCL